MPQSLNFVDVTVTELPLCIMVISVTINSQTNVNDIDVESNPNRFFMPYASPVYVSLVALRKSDAV